MAHEPVNHPLRPVYRALAGLTGLYVLVFGIIGVVRTGGGDVFAREDTVVLGLRTNAGFSIISVVAGIVILAGVAVGRNMDRFVNKWGGYAFLGVGMVALALLRTDANYLNFSMTTCIVSFVIGMVLLTAGLYGKLGTAQDAAAEGAFRHG
jgi:hypothetical protein